MNVRPRRHARNRAAKCREGNAISAQEFHQRLAFRAIGIQRDVHSIVVVEPPAIVNRSLAKHRDGQLPAELLPKEVLNPTGV